MQAKFQTIVDIPDYPWKTGYDKKHMFIGSCFTENVGNKMAELKYNVDVNPFGILYNPASVANSIDILIQGRSFVKKDIMEHNGLWHSFYHHGKFSFPEPDTTLDNINRRLKSSSDFLINTDYLILTFGTAWIYEYKTGQIVSNCHKIPAKEFKRLRLSVEEIVATYNILLEKLRQINTGIKVIFTVSPVRHWKDGAIENQRSKATLLLAIDQILNKNRNCKYFPSYEIVMDELRDYRFYNEDMIHVSDVGVKHIWERFEKVLIDDKSKKISGDILKINSALNHRPLNPDSDEYMKFLEGISKRIKQLEKKYPELDFKNENTFLKKRLNKAK